MNAVLKENQWVLICDSTDLHEKVGARALLNDEQVAIFRINGKLYAISAIDPFTNAAVLARGIIGSIDDRVVVASPIYKQHFDLVSGVCIEDESVKLKTYSIQESDNKIYLTNS